MHLKGKHTLNTSANNLWSILMNADQLAKITPGVSRLEEIETDKYKAISNVKIGPVKGSFSGDLEVADKTENKSFLLKVKQNSKIGNVAADVNIKLTVIDEQTTEMEFNGKANLSGLLARTGQRVLSGVANTLTKQFFDALEQEIKPKDT